MFLLLSLPRIWTMLINQDLPENLKTTTKKRKHRRQKSQTPKTNEDSSPSVPSNINSVNENNINTMSSNDNKSRDEVIAAREAKKLAKQRAKTKQGKTDTTDPKAAVTQLKETTNTNEITVKISKNVESSQKVTNNPNKVNIDEDKIKVSANEVGPNSKLEVSSNKASKDEVDKAAEHIALDDKDREGVRAERTAKKAAKQAKKKVAAEGDVPTASQRDMTVRDVVETLKDIKNVAKEVMEVTEKVQALDLEGKKGGTEKPSDESGKSKAELRAERRAKQEAQRAAKQATVQPQEKVVKPKEKETSGKSEPEKIKKEKSPKPKVDKQKGKSHNQQTLNWFGHLYKEYDKDVLNKIPINSNLHPAIIKLGVQLATRVVTGSNARCIALLDALKKMVRDYSLPAKTEFGRGLEAHLTSSLEFVWSMRQPTASQTNAIKFFRHHLNQLPNNVDEFDAKKTLQEEIDRYMVEQIYMAGSAISIAVRKKISNGDNILTYGCSSLIHRILTEAHAAGVTFRVVVCGGGASTRAARDMTRRLVAAGIDTVIVDITALDYIMRSVSKVLMGASALLGNGSVVGACGTAVTALAARAHNVPVLIACETHKFSEQVHTDAFVCNELGDPEELLDTSNENCPLKDWRSNPHLTPLNLTYDVTPPGLITAVVTELAILPCTSAPVVLRFKLSEYGIN